MVGVEVAEPLAEGLEIWTRWFDARQVQDLIHGDLERYMTFLRLVARHI